MSTLKTLLLDLSMEIGIYSLVTQAKIGTETSCMFMHSRSPIQITLMGTMNYGWQLEPKLIFVFRGMGVIERDAITTFRFEAPPKSNFETMMFDPISGYIYLLRKDIDGDANVYKFKPDLMDNDDQEVCSIQSKVIDVKLEMLGK